LNDFVWFLSIQRLLDEMIRNVAESVEEGRKIRVCWFIRVNPKLELY